MISKQKVGLIFFFIGTGFQVLENNVPIPIAMVYGLITSIFVPNITAFLKCCIKVFITIYHHAKYMIYSILESMGYNLSVKKEELLEEFIESAENIS